MKSKALTLGSVAEVSFDSNDWMENPDSLFSDQNPRRAPFIKSVTDANSENGQISSSNAPYRPFPIVTSGLSSSTPRPSSTAESTLLDSELSDDRKPGNILELAKGDFVLTDDLNPMEGETEEKIEQARRED